MQKSSYRPIRSATAAPSSAKAKGYQSSKKTDVVIGSLRERIQNNEWEHDRPLPPQRHLAEEYQVSQATISIAIRQLQKEGLIHNSPGQGIFISEYIKQGNSKKLFPTIGLRGSYIAHVQDSLSIKQGSFYASEVLHAIWRMAHKVDCPLLLMPGTTRLTRQYCQSQGVQGVVFLGGESYEEALNLRLTGYPVITANDPTGPSPINYVNHDHASCLREVIRRFVEAGHRRIGVFLPSTSMPGSFQKLKPDFIDALCHHNILYNVDDYWHYFERGKLENCIQTLDYMLSLKEPPTALFCHSGAFLPYIEKALHQRGISIPEDISLVYTSDGRENPTISSFALQYDEMARLLLDGLYETIKNPFYSIQTLIPPVYTDRGTIAPPRKMTRQ